MDYITIGQSGQMILDGRFRGGTLGEPPETKQQVDEATLKNTTINTFHNCDYIGTITIKGAYKRRSMANDMRTQLLLFIKIKDIINKYCQYYIINYELHKCSEWVHSHFVFRPFYRSKVPKMRQEIYELIVGHALKKKSYKHRVLIEKPYEILNYIEYMFKDYEDMKYYHFNSHYKLKSNPIICPKENLIIKTKKENPNNNQSTDQECPVLYNTQQ